MEQQPEDRRVSLEEGVAIAIQLQQCEQWAAAADLYRRILEVVPDHAGALHYSGVLAHQQGRSDEALALIRRSLELEPDRADWHSNLGIVHRDRLELDWAAAALQRAIDIEPGHANAHNNLGVVLRAQGKLAEAEASYRAAVHADPRHIDAHHNLGVLLKSQRRLHEAVLCFCKVITLQPKHREARRLLALAHCNLGEVDKAAAIFEEWLRDEPDNPIPEHLLAACTGRNIPARASDGFIQMAFDGFAATFDARLADLHYQAPDLVAGTLAKSGLQPAKALDVLDAGCGTGLCGPLLAPYARRLVGVDLSAGMLQKAEARHVYDALYKFELTAYLEDNPGEFDAIVSADTLVYFGPLERVAAAAAGGLRAGGLLVFTVEELIGGEAGVGYALRAHGRYCHSEEYLGTVLRQVDLRPEFERAVLRFEAGEPVAGLVVRARKPGEQG